MSRVDFAAVDLRKQEQKELGRHHVQWLGDRFRESLQQLYPSNNAKDLEVRLSLDGPVNVGCVLDELGFSDVQSLTFVAGGITRLVGVPDSVQFIKCAHNRLSAASLTELPNRLQVLLVHHNEFEGEIDVSHLTALTHLDMSHNKIKAFVGAFPGSLRRIQVTNNQLQILDLQTCPLLETVDADMNRKSLRILKASSSSSDARENNRFLKLREGVGGAVLRQEHTFMGGAEEASAASLDDALLPPMRLPEEFEDKVRNYFEQKALYEAAKIKHRLEGTLLLCPYCEKPGGMMFSGRDQKYSARCIPSGDACRFTTITINRGRFMPLRAYAAHLRTRLLAARESIIKLQYDALLGYLPQTAVDKQFPERVARYNGLFARFQEFQRRADEYYFSTVKAAKCRALRREMAQLLSDVRTLVDDRNYAQAARMQSGDVKPLSDQLGEVRFPGRGCDVDYNDMVGKSLMVFRDVNTRADTEYNVGAPL